MRCTSRGSAPHSKARRSAPALPPACMKANPGCGKTWSARSRAFWQHFYPALQRIFPDQLGGVTVETFYRAINKVERSLIRTDADEVTYNLHIMMRFDLELDLLEGRLRVKDLPEAWRERMQADLGLVPPDDRDGCLQDVHWYGGVIGGGFQGYTIGNILSAQFYDAALKANPEIPHEIAAGEFGTLHQWLRDARLSTRAQVQAERARGTGDRRRNEYRSLSIVSSQQVRRALSTAKHLMQAIFAIGPRCAIIIRRHTWTPACFGGMSCGPLTPFLRVRR